MNLLRMSFSAAIIIMVIIVLRALWLHKLPKKMFLVLWSVAVLRLLIPFSFPSMFSIYFLISQNPSIMGRMEETSIVDFLPIHSYEEKKADLSESEKEDGKIAGDAKSTAVGTLQWKERGSGTEATGNQPVQGKGNEEQGIMEESQWEKGQKGNQYQESTGMPMLVEGYAPAWTVVWVIGMSVCILFFSVTYILCCRRFRTSLPVENDVVNEWLLSHKIRRKISVRQSGCISAPLAYGFFRPVILMPNTMKWENSRQLQYILEHEFIHIRRLDAVAKLFLIAAVCVHWFNPMVWIMYILANRDIELSCDESVIRHFGAGSKSAYALSLIHMEEVKGSLMPLANNFSKNAAEERITAIMKLQKLSAPAYILAAVLVISVTAAFATSAVAAEQGGEGKRAGITAGQEVNIGTETKLSVGQQKELLEVYQKYGVSEDDGVLYYQNKPIRSLVDKYLERTYNEYGGKDVNTIRVYTYFNELGIVDVKVKREDKLEKTNITEVFKDVEDIVKVMPTAVTNMLKDVPKECVNRLVRNAAEEGRYSDVKKVVSYADTGVVDEIAGKMVEKGERIDEIVAYVSAGFIGKLYREWGFSFVRRLLPYMPWEVLNNIADIAMEERDYDARVQIEQFERDQMHSRLMELTQ